MDPIRVDQIGKTHAEVTGGKSSFAAYKSLIYGKRSTLGLIYFELCQLVSPMPGALGLLLRKLLWPRLFGGYGKGVVIGSNVTLMHPHRIHLGRRSVIGDGSVLDARTPSSESVIRLGEDCMLSHGVIISCKNGTVSIGDRCGVGAYTIIQSLGGANPVNIGVDVVIGPRCYITGSGNYKTDRLDIPIAQQGPLDMGGTRVGDGVWLGAGVSIQGGVEVGADSIIGTGAVVTKSVPTFAICGGVPARVLRRREDKKPETVSDGRSK